MSAEIQAAEARLAKAQADVERLRAQLADEQPAAEALTVTAAVYAPFAALRLDEVARAPSDALLTVLVLGVVCTALALVFALIREVGRQRALVITFLNPAVAVLLGVLLLDEPYTLGLAVGLPVVVLGCVLATRRSPARAGSVRPAGVDAAVP